MLTLTIQATTTTEAIESAFPFLDMRSHAIERRDDAAAVLAEQGDQVVLEVHEFDHVVVLYSPVFGYAYVNERSTCVGDSLVIDNAASAEDAAGQWTHG